MDRRVIGILPLFVLTIALAHAVPDVPWKILSTTRMIYELNIPSDLNITSSSVVYVDINIPQQYADDFYNKYIATGYFCSIATDPNNVYWYYPRVYYFSTDNTDQREKTITVVSTYDYTGCGGNTIRYPKEIRVEIQGIDGDQNYGNYQHYIAVYFPAGIYRDGKYGSWVGGGSWSLSVDMNLAANNLKDVLLKHDEFEYSDDQAQTAVLVQMKDGSKVVFSTTGNYIGSCSASTYVHTRTLHSGDIYSIYSMLSNAQYPLSDIDRILKVCVSRVNSYAPTYFQIIPFAPGSYP